MPRTAQLLFLFVLCASISGCGSDNKEAGSKPILTTPTGATGREETRLRVDGHRLKPGKYVSERFRPTTKFEVRAGWGRGYDKRNHLDLLSRDGANQLSFHGTLTGTPENGLKRLRLAKSLRVSHVTQGGFGPYEGLQFDAVPGAGLPVVFDALDHYTLLPGNSTRMWIVKAGDSTVVAAVQARAGDLESFLERAQPVLDSARFG